MYFDVNLPGAFNEDPRWHGFERIGSMLSLSPSHVDRYFKAAETVLELKAAGKAAAVESDKLAGGLNNVGSKEAVIARAYPQVLDIGCAEGYYAVGLARRMTGSRIFAHDTSASARMLAAQLAAANGVSDRVILGGEIGHRDFELCRTARTFVLCDIEGAEEQLLDPVAAPGLRFADILVEVHEGMKPGLTERLVARFATTHRVTRLGRRIDSGGLPDWTEGLGDLDRLLLLWEWRSSPTPWLWLERKDIDA